MPKLRMPAEEKENRALIATIKYGMEMTGVTHEQLALAMRESDITLYRRLKCPEEFTLAELRAISSKLHIPLEKMIKGEIA